MAGFLARYGNGVLDSVAAHIASWYSHALEADRGPPRLVAMAYLGIVLLIVLLIPIFAILTDSPLGRAGGSPAGREHLDSTPPRRARETGRASGERARGRHPESRNAPGGAPVLPAPPRGRRSPATAAVHPGILNPFRQGGAPLVAAGIFLSRLAGLVRQRVLSHYLGLSLPADAFNLAFRIPNFLHLFRRRGAPRRSSPPTRGCGPKERTRRRAASRGCARDSFSRSGGAGRAGDHHGAVAGHHPRSRISRGQAGSHHRAGQDPVSRHRTWCCPPGALSILNSHRRFFLSYSAPVLWNFAIILATVMAPATAHAHHRGALGGLGRRQGRRAALLVQLPSVLRPAGRPPGLGRRRSRAVLGNSSQRSSPAA